MVDAIVEFDYKAQHDDELTITGGDIITNIKKEDGGWWEGELKGRRGLFPDNFVRELKKDQKKEVLISKILEKRANEESNGGIGLSSDAIIRIPKRGVRNRRRRCQVAFSYMPQNEDELELKVGKIIEVLGEVEEGWWEGILNGRSGMFPSNFIKEISVEAECVGTPLDEHQMRPGGMDATGSESDGGDSSSTKSEGANGTMTGERSQPKKIRGFGFGDIFKDRPIKLRPRSIEVDHDMLPAEKVIGRKMPSSTSTQEPVKLEIDGRAKPKEYCKVLFPYEAQNEDELTIREGDTVAIITKDCVDAGWWEGEINGRRGMFPDNFVKLLPSEYDRDMSRPKKPPTPAATVLKSGTGTTERRHDMRKVPPERPQSLPNRLEEKEREQKQLDLQRLSVPAIPPKKPRPPKSNSLNRPGTLPPCRPERPAVPAQTRSDSPKAELLVSTVSSTPEKDSSERSNDIDLEGFDSVVSAGEKLNHPTASRPKAGGRRPPSQSLTSSSLSSPDIFDSPSPDDEKEDLISLTQKPSEISKKVPRTVTISQVSDNRAMLPPKPGGLASIGGNAQPGAAPFSAFHPVTAGTTGHRANSPSLFSTDGKPKTEHLSHGQSALEELRMQVKDLRSIIEIMKDQQKREIKQLLTELDEEKKICLRLQMDVNEIKKTLQSK